MTAQIPDPSSFDLGQSIRDTLAVAPTLANAPGVAVAVAQGNLSTTQTEQVAAFQRGQQLQQFMAGQDPDAQRQIYNALSSDDRTLLTQAGYQPPKAKSRSIWGTIIHDVGHAGNDVLHVLGAPLRAVQHVYRTVGPGLGIVDTSNISHTKGVTSFDANGNPTTAPQANILNPSSYVAAWRATSHGQRTFDTKALDAIKDKYSPDVYGLALRQAEGDSVQDITGGNPATLQAMQKVAQDPSYKQALADLQAAQISPGRDFANSLGIQPGSNAFKLTSGTADGLADWFGDPTLVGGKLAKAGVALKWGLRGYDSTRVEALMAKPQAQRGWNYIIPRLNTIKNSSDAAEKGQALSDLQRHFPNVMGLVDPLIQDAKNAGRDVTMESATNWLSSGVGMTRTLQGLAAREVPTLPGRLSKFGEARIAASDGLHKVIDFATDGKKYLPYDQLATPEEQAASAAEAGTAAEGTAQAAKAFGTAAFDYRKTLAGRIRYTARRLSTRVPASATLDVNSPTALKMLRQTALTYLPTSRANEITAAFASADLAGKRAIYKGALQELAHASGLTMSQSGSDYWQHFMGLIDASDAREVYSSLGNDSGVYVRTTASGRRSLGGTAGQITQKWSLPSFKEMQANAAKIGVADRVAGGLNQSWVDNFMGKWRIGVLLRSAFAGRVSLEDVFNAFFRGNGMGVLKARVATSLLAKSTGYEPSGAVMRSIGKVADGVSSLFGTPTSGSDIAAHYLLSKMKSVLNKGADLVMDPDYKLYIGKLLASPSRDRVYQGIVEDNYQLASGPGADPEDVIQETKYGKIGYRPNGDFDVRNAEQFNGALRWAHNLQYGSDDPVALHVMMNPEKSFEEILPELLDKMKSPEYEPVRDGAEIANWTKDGRSVAAGEATQDEALTDWAQDIYTNFQHLLRSGSNGKLIKPLVNYIKKNGHTPSAQWLNQREIDPATGKFGSAPFLRDRPDTVVGPEFVPYTRATAANLIQRGWDALVARPMNYLSRQPIVHHEYVQARKTLRPWQATLEAKGMSAENAERITDTRAQMIAHDRAIKFIHNPALRSQFSVLARNLFPFRHAEESALQRWGTAIAFSPEGLRRAQLTVEGLQHSGIITKDSSGNDYIAFPGSAALVNLSAKLANLMPGVNIAELPIKANMGFQLKFISPFLSQFGGIGTGSNPAEKILSVMHPIIPPSGPVLGMQLSLLNSLFPESRLAQDAQQALRSPEAPNAMWGQFVPTIVSRIYEAMGNSSDANGQLASAMRNAAAYMEAAGLSPSPDATPDEVDQYLNRLKSWSRNMLVMRAIFGFATPAAPTVDQFSPPADELFAAEGVHSLTDEFYKLTSQMPYEDALQTFIAMHPDDSPFTVAQSEAPSGAQMSATTDTLNWIDSHASLIKKYPSVAPFLMPLDSGPFNYDAYKEQLATGIRQKKSVSQFYSDLKIRTASDTYYAARNQVQAAEQQFRATGDAKSADALQAGFSAWSQQFQSLNPLFAQYLSQGSQRQLEKLQAVQQLQKMSDTGDLEQLVGSDQTQAVGQMLAAWNEWQTVKQALYGRSDKQAENMRKSTQAGVDQFISQVASQNPQLQGIYSTLFAPLLATE